MKITFRNQNGKIQTFEPSIYDEYGHNICEWKNALGVVAGTLSNYPEVIHIKNARKNAQNNLDNYDGDDIDEVEYYISQIRYINEIKNNYNKDIYFVKLKDCELYESEIVVAENEEDACKKLLFEKYKDSIIDIEYQSEVDMFPELVSAEYNDIYIRDISEKISLSEYTDILKLEISNAIKNNKIDDFSENVKDLLAAHCYNMEFSPNSALEYIIYDLYIGNIEECYKEFGDQLKESREEWFNKFYESGCIIAHNNEYLAIHYRSI